VPDTISHQLPDKQPSLRIMAHPRDTNGSGDIFGGWIMSQVDIAGAVEAVRVAHGRVATVAVNAFQFHQPVFVGDLVSCYAKVINVGRTSLTVEVELYAERNRDKYDCHRVTEATLTYVAVDENRNPRLVPKP